MATCDRAKEVERKDAHVPTEADNLDLGALVLAAERDHRCQVCGGRVFGLVLCRGPKGVKVSRVTHYPAMDVLDGGECTVDFHCVLPLVMYSGPVRHPGWRDPVFEDRRTPLLLVGVGLAAGSPRRTPARAEERLE